MFSSKLISSRASIMATTRVMAQAPSAQYSNYQQYSNRSYNFNFGLLVAPCALAFYVAQQQ
jgi:hypothetical protein